MPEQAVIRCTDLRKTYGTEEVLRGMTFEVPQGSIFALLGRNGAGKSTLMKILLGIARPTSGSAEVFGLRADDPAASVAIRKRTAFVSEEKDLCDYMRVEELLRLAAAQYPGWRSESAAEYTRNFAIPCGTRVKSLSHGMRTKLALSIALASGAQLLVLDEPTGGLDPASAGEVLHSIIGHVSREGATVLLASHSISEIDQIADRLAIVDSGSVVVSGTLDEICEAYQRVRVVFEWAVPHHAVHVFAPERVRCDGRTMTILARGNVDGVLLEARALNPVSIDVSPLTLREVFLESVAPEA